MNTKGVNPTVASQIHSSEILTKLVLLRVSKLLAVVLFVIGRFQDACNEEQICEYCAYRRKLIPLLFDLTFWGRGRRGLLNVSVIQI